MRVMQPIFDSLPHIPELTVLRTQTYIRLYYEGDYSCHYYADLMIGSHMSADEVMTLYITELQQKGWNPEPNGGIENLSSVGLQREPYDKLNAFTREPDEFFGKQMGYAKAKKTYPTIMFVIVNRLVERTACD